MVLSAYRTKREIATYNSAIRDFIRSCDALLAGLGAKIGQPERQVVVWDTLLSGHVSRSVPSSNRDSPGKRSPEPG